MDAGNVSSNSSGIVRRGRRSTRSLDFAIPYTAASGSFSFFGGASNLLVMLILIKYVGFNQKTYIYMFSLFLSDFLYNVIIQPHVCFYQFPTSTVTLFGMFYIHAASLACILTGTSCMFFASLDKYIFIKYPFFYVNNMTPRKTWIVVLCIWLVCIGLGVMRFHNIILIKDGYAALIAILFVLTVLVQVLIFVFARGQEKRIQQLNRSLEHNHPRGETNQNAVPSNVNKSSSKAAKTIGLLLVVYIVSWLPVNIYRLEYRFIGGDAKVYHKWIKIINLFIQLHSCINPYVFILRAKDMKIGVRKLMRSPSLCKFFVYEGSSEATGGNIQTATSQAQSRENIFDENGRNGSTATSRAQSRENIFDENGRNGSTREIEGEHVNSSYQISCENIASKCCHEDANFNAVNRGSQTQNIEGQDITSSIPKNGEIFTTGTSAVNQNMSGYKAKSTY